MTDIFKLFHVETKEDVYTFCLQAMINSGDRDFKKKVGEFFHIRGNYETYRGSIKIEMDFNSIRKKIIPDLILYNQKTVAVIESKMFSSEGYNQTSDYQAAEDRIKEELGVLEAQVSFFYFTLSGSSAESSVFEPIKWSYFYEKVLDSTIFEDMALEVVRQVILDQTKKYVWLENALDQKRYSELFSEEDYWIGPETLLVTGRYDDCWKTRTGDKLKVYNEKISGKGHYEFVTEIGYSQWDIGPLQNGLGIRLFVRIVWKKDSPKVELRWECFCQTSEQDKPYISMSKVEKNSPVFSKVAAKNQQDYKDSFKKSGAVKTVSQSIVSPTAYKDNSLTALKCEVKTNETLNDIIKECQEILWYYLDEIEKIYKALKIEKDSIIFDIEKYETANKDAYIN